MSVEERHLLNKIRFFEDMLLRSKDYRQQENIGKELTVMRIQLQKLRFNKTMSNLKNVIIYLLSVLIAFESGVLLFIVGMFTVTNDLKNEQRNRRVSYKSYRNKD